MEFPEYFDSPAIAAPQTDAAKRTPAHCAENQTDVIGEYLDYRFPYGSLDTSSIEQEGDTLIFRHTSGTHNTTVRLDRSGLFQVQKQCKATADRCVPNTQTGAVDARKTQILFSALFFAEEPTNTPELEERTVLQYQLSEARKKDAEICWMSESCI